MVETESWAHTEAVHLRALAAHCVRLAGRTGESRRGLGIYTCMVVPRLIGFGRARILRIRLLKSIIQHNTRGAAQDI